MLAKESAFLRLLPWVFAVIAAFAARLHGGNILQNPSFETVVITTGNDPTGYGYWDGDPASRITASDGITPLDGQYMLKFNYATYGGAAIYDASEVVQLVDLVPYMDLVRSGRASASAAAYFNRVLGDSQTDTLFGVSIFAMRGNPALFGISHGTADELARIRGAFITDGDPSTWQKATSDLALPSTTDYLAVLVEAVENVTNDLTGAEFDGHYADLVTLSITPEPATLSLLALGGLALLIRKKPDKASPIPGSRIIRDSR